MSDIKCVGVMTSGGDSPGMNAAIRAVVRTATFHGIKVMGIRRGYEGMIDNDIYELHSQDVANIIQRGGTLLKTARSKRFTTTEGMKQAYENLQTHLIDGLVLIGGDGTFRGAKEFYNQYFIPTIGLPGTIDKDLAGSDFTIGFDTAVNTAISAIDKIRDTAEAHDRLFIVEVMGRDAGYIALYSGIACGAEDILIPETPTDIDRVLAGIGRDCRRQKMVRIIVVAEGDDFGGAETLKQKVKERFPTLDVRTAILGHIQRGGSPSGQDRILSSRLGHAAIKALQNGEKQVMVGIVNGKIHYTPFDHAVKEHAPIARDFLDLIQELTG